MTHEASATAGEVFGTAELRTKDGKVIQFTLTTKPPEPPAPTRTDPEGENDHGNHA